MYIHRTRVGGAGSFGVIICAAPVAVFLVVDNDCLMAGFVSD